GGTGDLIKTGGGVFTLDGNSANTYTGMTTLNAGKLILGKASGNAIGGDLTISPVSGWGGSNSGVELAANEQIADDAIIYFTGTDWSGFRTEGFTETVGGLVSVSRGVVENSGGGQPVAVDGHLILNVASGGDYDFRRHMRDNDGGGATGILSLTKQGPGTQTLGGDQIRYTGATTVTGGALIFQDTTNLNTPITVGPNGAVIVQNSNTLRQNLHVDGTALLRQDTGSMNLGNLTISGDGTLNIDTGNDVTGIICGQSGNTYVSMGAGGQINVLDGILRNNNRHGYWAANRADMYVANGAFLDHYANSITVDALTGGGTVRNNYGGDADVTFTVGVANGTGAFTGIIDEIYPHTPTDNNTGVISLVKEGTGTQVLTGVHTYTGPTDINAGTLHIPSPGSIAGSILTTVGPNGRLLGDGTVGDLDVLGIVSPGNSVGTLTAGSTSMRDGSTYDWEMGVAGENNDLLLLLGDLNIDSLATLNLLDAGISQIYTGGARRSDQFDIIHYTGISGLPAGDIGALIDIDTSTIDTSLFLVWDPSQATVFHSPFDQRLYLTGLDANPIPEPATLALLGLGALALRRRRRR
ncbi:autotransporter-associated beta strand repeat-containing protein, partial [bacterium]|nr:autotransporter-associated beta strand repeat-containing protein [bacterium]